MSVVYKSRSAYAIYVFVCCVARSEPISQKKVDRQGGGKGTPPPEQTMDRQTDRQAKIQFPNVIDEGPVKKGDEKQKQKIHLYKS